VPQRSTCGHLGELCRVSPWSIEIVINPKPFRHYPDANGRRWGDQASWRVPGNIAGVEVLVSCKRHVLPAPALKESESLGPFPAWDCCVVVVLEDRSPVNRLRIKLSQLRPCPWRASQPLLGQAENVDGRHRAAQPGDRRPQPQQGMVRWLMAVWVL